jgi:tetratricopeptide (TPR) repeat protein
VRHRAERFKPELLTDIIFDVGFLLSPERREDKMEERLRRRLKDAPWDGLAAANLATILLKKQEFEEARRWLRQALRVRYSLPDNGRRAEMELRELNRRTSSHKSSVTPPAAEGSQTRGKAHTVSPSLQTSNGTGPHLQVTDVKTQMSKP